jgi:hypothetical protein
MNADRMDMKKLLGVDGQGKNGTIGLHIRPQRAGLH